MDRSGFSLIEDSATTSGAPPGTHPTPFAGSPLGPTEVRHIYWKPIRVEDRTPGVYAGHWLTGFNLFFHSMAVTTTTYVSVVSATDRSVEYAFHQPGTVLNHSFTLRNLELPPLTIARDTWTLPGWELAPAMPEQLAGGIANVERVINDLRLSRPILRSPRLMRIADTAAVAKPQAPEDLGAWARKLADDVKHAND